MDETIEYIDSSYCRLCLLKKDEELSFINIFIKDSIDIPKLILKHLDLEVTKPFTKVKTHRFFFVHFSELLEENSMCLST